MGKKTTVEDIEKLVARVIETLKKQQEQINQLNEKIASYTEAYQEGIKEGIAFMVQRGK